MIAVLFIGMASLAYSIEPINVIKEPVDKVIGILRDPQFKDDTQKEVQREKIWEIVQGFFDFKEIAKRTLAQNWKIFTPQQRKEFTDVFGEFLGKIYIDKMQGQYHDETVTYLGQEMITDSQAVVKTRILRKTVEIPIHYSMRLNQGDWKIYDMNIEGVSLVKNYRIQFRKTLLKESPAELIERLRKKVEP